MLKFATGFKKNSNTTLNSTENNLDNNQVQFGQPDKPVFINNDDTNTNTEINSRNIATIDNELGKIFIDLNVNNEEVNDNNINNANNESNDFDEESDTKSDIIVRDSESKTDNDARFIESVNKSLNDGYIKNDEILTDVNLNSVEDLDRSIGESNQSKENNKEDYKECCKHKIKRRVMVISIISSIVAITIFAVLIFLIVKFSTESSSKQTTLISNSTTTLTAIINTSNKKQCKLDGTCDYGYFPMYNDFNNDCNCLRVDAKCFNKSKECNGLLCSRNEDSTISCDCIHGFRWSFDSESCVDLNECVEFICDVSTSTGKCVNQNGSFYCGCKPGFAWSNQYQTCVDVDECLTMNLTYGNRLGYISNPCQANNSVCINTYGSFYCTCQGGYTNSSNTSMSDECMDINECEKNSTLKCSGPTQCVNKNGTYECCEVSFNNYTATEVCYSCGYQYHKPITSPPKASRIIGGTTAEPYSWPWIVSIGINYKYRSFNTFTSEITTKWYNASHICGGTLISDNYVITAAHCVQELASNNANGYHLDIKPNPFHPTIASILTVYVGVYNQTEDKKKNKNIFRVSNIIVHPQYDSNAYLNDIALLKLHKKVTRSTKTDWICLGDETNFKFPSSKSTLYAIGFGLTLETEYSSVSDILNQVDLKLLDFDSCSTVTKFLITNTDSQFCAGYSNGLKDTCAGDSGGPLMYQYQNRWYIVGVISYGQGCGESGKPGINTNVSFYSNWIKYQMKRIK